MVRFGIENALSQKGTGARRFFRLGLTPSFHAARASYPSDFEENKRLLAVYKVAENLQTLVWWRQVRAQQHTNVCKISRLCAAISSLDCEQSLFFFRFSKGSARAKRLAASVTRVALCVSRVLLDGQQKKQRLLVVYTFARF